MDIGENWRLWAEEPKTPKCIDLVLDWIEIKLTRKQKSKKVVKKLIKDLSFSDRSVQKALSHLIEVGWIKKIEDCYSITDRLKITRIYDWLPCYSGHSLRPASNKKPFQPLDAFEKHYKLDHVGGPLVTIGGNCYRVICLPLEQ
jgi:hypothetical protein